MAKNGLELKNAIQNLKISRPFDLRGQRQVELKPPKFEQTQKKGAQNEDSQNEQTQNQIPQIGHPHSEGTQFEQAVILKLPETPEKSDLTDLEEYQNQQPQIEVPQFENTQSEEGQIQGAQNENPQTEVPETDPPQGQAPQIQHPHSEDIESPQPRSAKKPIPPPEAAKGPSFFMMSHGIFADPQIRELPGDAFRIYLWMSSQAWRYPDSVGVIRAAVGYISVGTGVSTATVSRCLQILKATQLIRLVETDFKRGNSWFVTDYALAKMSSRNQHPQIENPQNKATQCDAGAVSKREGSSINLIKEPHQIDVEVKKSTTLKINPNNSLSAKIRSVEIQTYFDGLKSFKKQETERKAFWDIHQFHSEENIEKALLYVLKNGTPPKGEPCHSPMAFLSVAIAQVLRLIERQEEEEQRRLQKQRQREASVEALKQKQSIEAESDLQAEEEATRLDAEFIQVFPSEADQQAQLAKFRVLFPMLNPKGEVYRKLAIAAWHKQKNQGGV